MPGQSDVVRDEMTVEGRSGDATTLPSGRHNMLISDLCNGMETTLNKCVGHTVQGSLLSQAEGWEGRLPSRGICASCRNSWTKARSYIRESFTPAIQQPGDPSPQQLCRTGPGVGVHPNFMVDNLNTSLHCTLVAVGLN